MASRHSARAIIGTRRILVTVLAILAACTLVLAWPMLKSRINRWKEHHSIVAVEDAVQWDIVRAYLQHYAQRNPGVLLYFDTKSAALCSPDRDEPCDRYEFRSAEREDALVDRTYTAVPLELQRKLDRMTLTRSYNTDPRLPAVQTLTDAEKGAFDQACAQAISPGRPQLIRMSRAAMDTQTGRALAMVQLQFCDDSGTYFVASFIRNGEAWDVAEGNLAGRESGRR